jgi:hypothetical protein
MLFPSSDLSVIFSCNPRPWIETVSINDNLLVLGFNNNQHKQQK